MNILRFLREQAKDYDCSKCGTNHARSDIRLLGKLDAAWIVRVTCSKCDTSFKLLVVIILAGVITAFSSVSSSSRPGIAAMPSVTVPAGT